jgi:hypothetical protein
VRVRRGASALARRGLLAAVLIGAAVIPGHASGSASRPCPAPRCGNAGTIRWTRPLPGSWITLNGPDGTVAAHGQAYAAVGGDLAAVGLGMTIYGYGVRAGHPLWTATLSGFPAGSSIVSVRAWQSVITAGVAVPGGRTQAGREEVVLSARTGRRIRAYRAATYGGAVAADAVRSVIVGASSVTSYDNATGKVIWNRPTGRVAQAWRISQGELYVTVAAGGYLGTAPVTALRRISLRTGQERLVRPAHGPFTGSLSGAADGVLLFSGDAGVSAYSGGTGQLLWQRPGAGPETVDPARQTLYVTAGSALLGLDPRTGARIRRASVPGAAGVYGVLDGIALGLDQGAGGVAWGYDVTMRRVVWTTPAVPWPHYFVDLSGIGGSANPVSSTVLLASCARLSTASASGTGQACLRPELAAVRR